MTFQWIFLSAHQSQPKSGNSLAHSLKSRMERRDPYGKAIGHGYHTSADRSVSRPIHWPESAFLDVGGGNQIMLDISSTLGILYFDMAKNAAQLGEYLKKGREAKRLTLRAVEEETQISNGYLSQLEGGKIEQPSPVDLNELCELYELEYTIAMEYAGYPIPKGVATSTAQQKLLARLGNIAKDDEDALVDYMEFLRSKKRKAK